MIQKEAWYREALDPEWQEFQRAHGRGELDAEGYQRWARLALRTRRFDLAFFRQFPKEAQQQLLQLRSGMAPEAIKDVWEIALLVRHAPYGLTLDMLKRGKKAGVEVYALTWLSSAAYVPGDSNNDWSLQYDGAVDPGLQNYNPSADPYHDTQYQYRGDPERMLKRLKKLGWVYDEGLGAEREHAPGTWRGRSHMAPWARNEPVHEELQLHLIELQVQIDGKSETVPPGYVSEAWDNWILEVFG